MGIGWRDLKPGEIIKPGDYYWSPLERGDRWRLVEDGYAHQIGEPYRILGCWSVTILRPTEEKSCGADGAHALRGAESR